MKHLIIRSTLAASLALCCLFGVLTVSFAGEWEAKAPLLRKRWGLGTETVNGKIYAIGGWNGGAGVQEIENEVYQPPGWPFPAKFSVDPRNKLATTWGTIKAH